MPLTARLLLPYSPITAMSVLPLVGATMVTGMVNPLNAVPRANRIRVMGVGGGGGDCE